MKGNKISIRPAIRRIGTSENKTEEEAFQNETLRPIIKLQYDILFAFFKNHLNIKKVDFADLSDLRKRDVIENLFKKDAQFKAEMRGLIIGLFTFEEYNLYQKMATSINKRIMSIVKQRLLSLIV